MKRIVYLACLLTIVAGCVSNKTFKIEQAKAQQVEQRQFQLMGQIEAMRSDLQSERDALMRIHGSLQDIENLKALPEEVKSQISSMNEVVDSLQFMVERKVPLLQDNVDYMMERITTLQDEFADNNKILIDLVKRVDSINAQLSGPKVVTKESQTSEPVATKTSTQPTKIDIYPVTAKQTTVTKPPAPAKATVKLEKVPTLEEREAKADAETTRLIKAYKYAKARFDAGDYSTAIALFSDMLRDYTDDPYAANAQYWIAESHYSMSDYSGAIPEFIKVTTEYPTSPKAPDAMLKIGLCYEKTGDNIAARNEYNAIKTIYPGYERMEMVERLLKLLPY